MHKQCILQTPAARIALMLLPLQVLIIILEATSTSQDVWHCQKACDGQVIA